MSGVITGKDAIRAISEDNFNFDWINSEDYKIPENPEVEKDILNQWQISQDEKSLASSKEFTSETAIIKKSMDRFFNMDIKDNWKESCMTQMKTAGLKANF